MMRLFTGDQCPMYFDDGSYPWTDTDDVLRVFDFGYYSSSTSEARPMTIFITICVTSFVRVLTKQLNLF